MNTNPEGSSPQPNDRAKPTAQLVLKNYAGAGCDVTISRVDGFPRRGYDGTTVEFTTEPDSGPPWLQISEVRKLLKRMEEMKSV